jgi:hypothetical protein
LAGKAAKARWVRRRREESPWLDGAKNEVHDVKVLAIGHPRSGVRWEHIAPYVGEQARSVWERYESEQVREFYLRADHRPGVVLVLECDGVTEAERLVAALPISEADLLDFEVIPLRPYMGFRELFRDPT